MTAVVVGVDPGGRCTGLVTRLGDDLVTAVVITRPEDQLIGDHDRIGEWIELVVGRVGAELSDAAALTPAALAGADEDVDGGVLPDGLLLAVEGVRRPNPHVKRRDGNSLTNPDGIIATAAVLGALLARWPAAVIVPPGGNGLGHLSAYPPRIGSGARLGGPSSHARAAWDVAGAACFLARVTRAGAPR